MVTIIYLCIYELNQGTTGIVTAVGEQPIKGLISTSAQARMTVGECLTNLMWAPVTKLEVARAHVIYMHVKKMYTDKYLYAYRM